MFKDRQQAGRLLAEKLKRYKGREDVLVFAIPRGGVVVAKEVASFLGAKLDVIVVKKIGAPGNPELAIGAVGPKKVVYWDRNLRKAIGASKYQIRQLADQKENEREERERLLRGKRGYPNMKDKVVIIIDDGVATGATSIVAGKFAKKMGAKKIVLAAPVVARDTLSKIKRYFDEIIYLDMPEDFYAVGQFYEEFPQVSDDEVISILSS